MAETEQPAPVIPSQADNATISWTASEFVAHEKSSGWYLILAVSAVVITAIVYLITRDKLSSLVVLLCALALGVLAARKPKQLQYAIGSSGITIGQKHFGYSAFKSFSVVPEDAFSSIVLMPLKRFAPLTTIYYSPEDEEKIIKVLSGHLPFEQHKLDPIDSFMRRIRF